MEVDEPPAEPYAGRTVDIELGGHEVITIGLDDLDPLSATDITDLLKEGNPKVSVWNQLASGYMKAGHLDCAEKIAQAALDTVPLTVLPPVYLLLANVQIARARKAPKIILPNAQRDDMSKEKPKDKCFQEAAFFMNSGDRSAQMSGGDARSQLAFLTRGIQQLATRSLDDAMQSFESVLADKPTNLVALMGKARILYAKRQYTQALKIFQQVLTLSPYSLPDPRIGIGLCSWSLDQKAKAKAAWERSLEVHPSEWPAHLLLGLEAINSSKNPNTDEEDRAKAYAIGAKHVERAFNLNQRNAAAANALCDFFLRKGDHKRAHKLAERTIQFADTLTLLSDGYVHAGQIARADGLTSEAMKHFNAALKGHPKHILAALGLAQAQVQNDEIPAAIHTLDTLVQPPNPQRSLEAMVMLASLRAFPRPGISSSDAVQEKQRAQELFDDVVKILNTPASKLEHNQQQQSSIASLSEDVDMYVEIARLWQDDNLERVRKALQEAQRIKESGGSSAGSKLVNNLAVLRHLEGDLEEAQRLYERALTDVSSSSSAEAADSTMPSILYNLARVYEDQGQEITAKDAYDKLLARHPEYADAKIRQAQLLSNQNRPNEAHELIKQGLSSQPSNLNVRAFYTHFLIESNLIRAAKDFVFITLKDFNKHDVYSLCAAGWLHFQQARESRDGSSKGLEDRKRGFQRSAEFYEKALQQDPLCAIAAQGLAIVTAEDVLNQPSVPGSADETAKRMKNAREALDVFGKIRESVNDWSVYLNMGHCYYAREEMDRAIESYETASRRCHSSQQAMILSCLCRSWYAKANKDQSFTCMTTALKYAQTALHLSPNDKAILYNIAMIEQKAVEMMFNIQPSKRTLKDLQRAIDQGIHAQKLFASLAADRSDMLPYSKDIADQRRKYGDNMLRKGDEHLMTQQQHEEDAETRLRSTRQKRQEEKDRQNAIEQEREGLIREQALKLAENRRKAREEAQAWSLAARVESDEERERRPRKSAVKKATTKSEPVSADEALEPAKKRKGKLKKEIATEPAGSADGLDTPLFSGDEDDRPAKRRQQKKRVVRDDDEEEAAANASRKKQFKSKETISDSDE